MRSTSVKTSVLLPHAPTTYARRSDAGRLNAVFGSDIGHWDVVEMNRVLEEAWEQVEQERMAERDFRSFVFENAVRLHGGMNPDFFAGTPVEGAARKVLESAPRA